MLLSLVFRAPYNTPPPLLILNSHLSPPLLPPPPPPLSRLLFLQLALQLDRTRREGEGGDWEKTPSARGSGESCVQAERPTVEENRGRGDDLKMGR